ncbi:MAG: GHKL domain-containing protein [Fibrobacteres bacterium]|nr:GHKL domain-containing protein [Fibrobacterota bacterium]
MSVGSNNNSSDCTKRYETLGKMTTRIAHDINNMLSIIGGNVDIIAKSLHGTEKSAFALDRLERIVEAAKKCQNLTDSVVDYANYETKPFERFDLHDVLRSMVNLIGTVIPKGVKVNSAYRATNAIIYGRPSEMEDVVVNVLQNANEAMHERGKLEIKTSNITFTTPRESEFGFITGNGDFLLLSISDNGYGMTEETRRKIFEPFFTTKEKGAGTGLGLNNVYNIVKSYGGFIEVTSKPACGTTFDIYLPVVEQSVEVADVVVSEKTVNVGKSDFAVA